MKYLFPFILFTTTLFTLSAQVNTDSTYYWVNKKYMECVDSGLGVCHCQEIHKYLMMDYNGPTMTLTIEPSIYHSWENITTKVKQNITNVYLVVPSYGIDSGYFFIEELDRAFLSKDSEKVEFIKVKVKPIEKNVEQDLGMQIGILNAGHLLNFKNSNCDNSKPPLLSRDNLKTYMKNGVMRISCSDDYHYDEMSIKGWKLEYFMEYKNGSITIYPVPLRDRFQKVDVNTIPECQTFIVK